MIIVLSLGYYNKNMEVIGLRWWQNEVLMKGNYNMPITNTMIKYVVKWRKDTIKYSVHSFIVK